MTHKKIIYDTKNSPVETITLSFVEYALKVTNSTLIREKIAYNFIKKGWVDLENGKLAKAFKSFNRSLKIFIQKEDIDGYLLSCHGIASVYTSCNEYTKALEIFFDILNRLEETKSDLNFITLKDIAVTYYKLGEYSESLNYLRIAMDSINNDNSIYRKIYLNYYMGKALLKLDKIDSAQEALFMTLTLCDANNINYKIAEALTHLGNIFRKKQNYLRSESFHIRALQYAKTNKDYKAHINVLLNMGSLFFYSGDYKKALQFINSAMEEMNHLNRSYKERSKAFHYLYLTLNELGDKSESIAYIQKSIVLREDEQRRVAKIQFDILKIKLRFNIKSESFIFKSINEHQFSDINKSSEDMKEMITAVYKGIRNIITFDNISIYSKNNSDRNLTQTTIFKNQKSETRVIESRGEPALYTIEHGKELIIYNRDDTDDKFSSSKLTKGMESFIILPVKRGDNIVGAISIEDSEKGKYTMYDLNVLKTISAYVSLSIENFRIKNEVESLNTLMESDTVIIESKELEDKTPQKDRESGLPQKALFIELLSQAIKETKRKKNQIALFTIIIDLDFEKKDGFISEDIIIGEHSVTQRIKSILRSEDILGKEFDDTYLLAIKLDSIHGLRVIAQKIIFEVTKPIFTENQKIVPRIKIGISIYPENALSPEDLIDKASKTAEKIIANSLHGYEFSDPVHNITSID